jgi:hypothetical protein
LDDLDVGSALKLRLRLAVNVAERIDGWRGHAVELILMLWRRAANRAISLEAQMFHTGNQSGYYWLASRKEIRQLPNLSREAHQGLHVGITSFDSGPLSPVPEEEELGWTMQARVMVSPPLTNNVDIPYDNHDEWYFVERPCFDQHSIEIFVNFCGFTLAPPTELDATADREWIDFLNRLQERFWEQLERVRPVTYVAMGEFDIVVSQKRDFVDRVRAEVEHVRIGD